MHEFFAEGDEEAALGIEIGALNDRQKIAIPKAQVCWEASALEWRRKQAPLSGDGRKGSGSRASHLGTMDMYVLQSKVQGTKREERESSAAK